MICTSIIITSASLSGGDKLNMPKYSQIWKKLVETEKETLSEPATARMFLPPPPSTFIKMLECVNLFNWLFKIKLSKLNH